MESYINQVDFFKGNDPEKIAQEYGTPLYVYNEEIIRRHMDAVAKVITKYLYSELFCKSQYQHPYIEACAGRRQ